MSTVYLRCKIRTLTAEARIIRHEEQKFPTAAARKKARKNQWQPPRGGTRDNPIYHGLHLHRVETVRRAARSSLLAYGFLLGRPYRMMESKCYEKPDWPGVLQTARRFGTVVDEEFNAWRDEISVNTTG